MTNFGDLFDDVKEKENKVKPVTYVGFVWDHSGSMTGSAELARTNFNEQLNTLKKDADDIEFLVTIIEFDDKVKEVSVNKPIELIRERKEYWIGGMTALYDSVGLCINKISKAMEKDKRKDKAALIIVMTDGFENASTDYNNERIKKLIKEMDAKDDWTFTFMGAGIDEKQAMDMGFSILNTMTFDKTAKGYNVSTTSQSTSLSSYSTMRKRGETKVDAFYNGVTSDKSAFVKDESKTVGNEEG